MSVTLLLEWGRVVDEEPKPLAQTGEILFNGDSIYVRIANPPDSSTIHCSLFDVSPSGQIALLTRSEPSGVELRPGEDYVIGADRQTRRLTGLPVSWPARVPPLGQRVETLLVVASDKPQDLRALEQRGVRAEPDRDSSLRRIVDQLGYGGARDIQPESGTNETVRYAVEHITFLVDPGSPPSRDESAFLIDDRPDLSNVYRVPRVATPDTAVLALRLTDLIVHRNRRLFGSAFSGDVRVDTIVVTGPTGGDMPTYRMETARFSGIRDG
jgi:hypothetical protein